MQQHIIITNENSEQLDLAAELNKFCETQEPTQCYIDFEGDFAEDQLIACLDNIIAFGKKQVEEHQAEIVQTYTSIKKLSTNNKIIAIKHLLSNPDVIDSYMVLNLFNLIKGFNTFTDEYFKSDAI